MRPILFFYVWLVYPINPECIPLIWLSYSAPHPNLVKAFLFASQELFNFLLSLPPIWELSSWTTVIYVITLLLCIRFLIVLNTHRLEKKHKRLEQLLANRASELKETQEALALKNTQVNDQSTQLKKVLAQLEESKKMSTLGQLTAGIAHEINNPINFIHANIDTLNQNIQDILRVVAPLEGLQSENRPDTLQEIQKLKEIYQFDLAVRELNQLIQGIREGSSRTTQIIQGLRFYSKEDNDALVTTNIHEHLDSTLVLLQHRFKGRVNIVKDYQATMPIEAYPNKLKQVFMNLLANALDAIEKTGTITIATQNVGSKHIQISIHDTGSGISDDLKEQIYQPFFTTKSLGEGIGLGLSIVSNIIKRHQGKIQISSKRGHGTQFDIQLPVRQ